MKNAEKKEKLGKLLELRQAMENGADWSFLELQKRVREILKNDFGYSFETIEEKESEARDNLGWRAYHNRFQYIEGIYKQAVPTDPLIEAANLTEVKATIFSVDAPVYLIGSWTPLDIGTSVDNTVSAHEIGYKGKKPSNLSDIDREILEAARYINHPKIHPYFYLCTASHKDICRIKVEKVIQEIEFREDYE